MAGNLLLIVFTVVTIQSNIIHGLEIKQLVLLSRHNIRSPLNANLEKITHKSWPVWQDQLGYLTQKGAKLEEYLGEYFSEWFKQTEGWFFEECPQTDLSVFFANSPQRTVETAKAFVKSAFKGCNVSVHHNPTLTMDPVFNPIITNNAKAFRKTIKAELKNNTNKSPVGYKDALLLLNKILDIKNSDICRREKLCDLSKGHDVMSFEFGEEPEVIGGPLFYAHAAVDAFLMAYYNGFPLEEIGWRLIKPEHWSVLTKITRQHQNVRFNSTTLARNVAKPLLIYMHDIFLSENIKLALLVGHDSNLNSVMKALGVQYYELPAQNELTPIGGKIAFQKMYDKQLDRDFVKITYFYLTTEQLRAGNKLSLDNPPKSIDLEIKGCSDNGMCLWNEFLAIMEKSIQ